jgi:presenilin-like A22 family membrane protease
MWSWNQFKNLPKNQSLSATEKARQYFIHQSNMMMEASSSAVAAAAASAAAGAGAGAGGSRKKEFVLILTFDDINNVTDFNNFSGDFYSINDWNRFFDLPEYGTPFTTVEVNDNIVKLSGGSDIIMRESLFDGSDSLLEVNDTGCIIELQYNVFGDDDDSGSYELVSVNFPNVTAAGDYCFYYCDSLVSVNLPNLIIVGNECFSNCTSLESVSLPALTSAGDNCFYYCNSLISVSLPKLISAGDSCFRECQDLESISLPSCLNLGPTVLDNNVFTNISGNDIVATFNPLLLTSNAGGPDGDIQYLGIFNSLTINNQPYAPFTGYEGDLTIEFNDIENADILVGDSSNVEDWNTFFDFPNWSTPFTNVSIDRDTVILEGGKNILINQSFQSNTNIISILDQGCICYIEDSCFSGCDSLTTIDFPELTFLNNGCFENCESLINVSLPKLTLAGDYCFYNCNSLITISLPELILAGSSCFTSCESLTTVDLPELTVTGAAFFQDCDSLITISLPKLTTIQEFNFLAYCNSLVSVSLPLLTAVSSQCFTGCTSLTDVSLPALVTTEGNCFYQCTALTTIDLPALVTGGSSIFYQCFSLTDVNLPSLVNAGPGFFSECFDLTNISLPLCTNLGGSVLNNDVFSIFGSDIVLEVNPILLTCNNGGLDGDLFTLTSTNTITINGSAYQPFTGFTGDLTLGFDDITDADTLVGDSSNVEDWNLFFGLPGWSTEFTSLSIDGSEITLIGGENIVLLNRLFEQVNIVSLDDQGCVCYVGESCFYQSSLVNVSLPSLTTLSDSCFNQCQSLETVSLPALTSAGDNCFYYCSALTTISLPLLSSVGNGFFNRCQSLETVSLPLLISMESVCFFECSSLTSISLPLLISMESGCFFECSSLTSISLPELTIASGQGFTNCQSLVSVDLPKLVTAEFLFFSDCQSLESVSLPALVTAGQQCFYNCTALTTIDLPALINLGYSSFSYCESLISLSAPLCTNLGGSVGDNQVFSEIEGNIIELEINPILLTCNDGEPDVDLILLGSLNILSINGNSPFTGYTGDLTLGFDDITDADTLVGDSSNVEDWNLFFNLPGWSTEFSSVSIDGNEVTLIGGENIVFRKNRFEEQSVVLVIDQGCVCYVGESCFYQSSLVSVDLPSLTTLSYSCFYNCQSLVSITLPALTTAGRDCFAYCESLEVFSLPAVTSLGSNCFESCISLTELSELSFPLLLSIPTGCFTYCTSLTTINLSELDNISNNVFLGCDSLFSINLPAVTFVDQLCFSYCTALVSISLPLCTNLGGSINNNNVFESIAGLTMSLTIPAALMTCNDGDPDGDIVYLQENNEVTIIEV